MSDSKVIICDNTIEEQLEEKSAKLNISLEELVERYIKRGLFMDDYYDPPEITEEEFVEMCKRDAKKDMERGITPKKHDFDVFIDRWNKSGPKQDIDDFHYEIKNEKLKEMVEKKAKQLGMSDDQLIWGYVNRGLMDDNFDDDVFNEVHSEEFLREVNEALGLD